MIQKVLGEIEAGELREWDEEYGVGDTVEVGVRIREGEKERVQIFTGTVLGFQGAGVRETFTVRRIVQGEGVERVFPIHSPRIHSITVKRRGDVRRAKLYYLRDRVGKKTRVKEKIWRKEDLEKSRARKKAAKKSVAIPTATPPAEEAPETTPEATSGD